MAFVWFVPSFCLVQHATDDSFNSAFIFAREVSRTGGVKHTRCLGRYENLFILRHLAQDMTARRLQRSVVEKCPRTPSVLASSLTDPVRVAWTGRGGASPPRP